MTAATLSFSHAPEGGLPPWGQTLDAFGRVSNRSAHAREQNQ